jgi:hydroxymethylbilane synthase
VTRLRLATRGSQLALAQSGWVARRVETLLGVGVELVTVKTSGDRLADVSLAKLGGKGLFVKEIEEALLADAADLAVHSAKDLPAALAPGLALAAFPERADARDALVARAGPASLLGLAAGARVGTGSARRSALLRALRPDLEVLPLRGNVTTRLDRLAEGRFDALLVACAGLDRLGLGDRIHERVAAERLLPAVGQGVLAIETRAGSALASDLAVLTHAPSARALAAERAFLARLEGDCNVPLAAHAEVEPGGALRLRGLVARPDGAFVARAEARGADPEALGRAVAEQVLERGGAEILAALREPERSEPP